MANFSQREIFHIGLTMAILPFVVSGERVFEKHFGYSLSEPSRIVSNYNVRGPLECEKHCLFRTTECAAANVILINPNVYNCEIFAELPGDFSTNMLRANPKGRFLYRTASADRCLSSPCQSGGTCVDTGVRYICRCPPYYVGLNCDLGPDKIVVVSCANSSRESESFGCENAHDGLLSPGSHMEWSAERDDDESWIRLEFRSAQVVGVVKIWWRCAGRSQYSKLTFSFNDGTNQTVTHQCSSETVWNVCGDEPAEVYYINPVLTSYVHIAGVDCKPGSGNNGFREVEFWTP